MVPNDVNDKSFRQGTRSLQRIPLTMDGYGSINVKDILPYILAPYTGILCLTLF
jgi:hypothetical protein